MATSYYRGPSEPDGDDLIVAEVVDGVLRRRVEIAADGSAKCIDYGTKVDMTLVADYVFPITESEFNEAWTAYCSAGVESTWPR